MAELNGTCLCGSVSLRVSPEQEQISVCHCSKCRVWSGGPFVAIPCGTNVKIKSGDTLGVYKSSEWAERTFCKNCGTVIAWRLQDDTDYHVSASLFDETARYKFTSQIFIDEKPENYSFAEQTKTMTGAEVFAMFAPPEGN